MIDKPAPIPYDSRVVSALRRRHEDREFVEMAQRIAKETNIETTVVLAARPAGDPAELRGIPAVGVRGGFGGAIRGTRPGDGLDDVSFGEPLVGFG